MAKKDYTNCDRNELIREIDQLCKRKKYGFVWEDNPENDRSYKPKDVQIFTRSNQ